MPKEQQKRKVKARGVSNRNKGLQWIRQNFVDANGVIYFADDDNTYDLRLFDEVSYTIVYWTVMNVIMSVKVACIEDNSKKKKTL